jgi:hypothetical protein
MDPKQSDTSASSPAGAPVGFDPDDLKGLVGRTSRAEPETDRAEVGLEDRFEDDLGRRHHHPVTHTRDTQWPGLTRLARLGDMDPPQRLRPVGPGGQLSGEFGQEHFHPGLLDGIDRHAVDAGSPPVEPHIAPRPDKDVAAGDLVEEGMEPSLRILLGAAVEHALEGLRGGQTIGLSDGPSRLLGTHQLVSQSFVVHR